MKDAIKLMIQSLRLAVMISLGLLVIIGAFKLLEILFASMYDIITGGDDGFKWLFS